MRAWVQWPGRSAGTLASAIAWSSATPNASEPATDGAIEHATNVGVHGADRPPEGQRGDGPGRVRPHPRQPAERIEVVGHLPAVLLDDGDRRSPERQRPPVVAEAAPGPEHGGRGGIGERRRRRELGEERAPGLGGAGGLGLLRHRLGHEDRPRVGGRAERERPAFRVEPGEDGVAELDRHRGSRRTGEGHARTIPAMRFGAAFWIQRTDWPSLREACLRPRRPASTRSGWTTIS